MISWLIHTMYRTIYSNRITGLSWKIGFFHKIDYELIREIIEGERGVKNET